jgi:hypothetical protein
LESTRSNAAVVQPAVHTHQGLLGRDQPLQLLVGDLLRLLRGDLLAELPEQLDLLLREPSASSSIQSAPSAARPSRPGAPPRA